MLRDTIADALQRRIAGEFELVLDDPRRAAVTDGVDDPDATDPLPSWSALVGVYQSVLHDVVAALDEQAGHRLRRVLRARVPRPRDPAHRMPMGELQRLMHPRYSQPGFSRLVQRMEADGLVERRLDPADRRATIVMSTARGARYEHANAVYSAAVHEHFGRHVDGTDIATITEALARVAQRRTARRRKR